MDTNGTFHNHLIESETRQVESGSPKQLMPLMDLLLRTRLGRALRQESALIVCPVGERELEQWPTACQPRSSRRSWLRWASPQLISAMSSCAGTGSTRARRAIGLLCP